MPQPPDDTTRRQALGAIHERLLGEYGEPERMRDWPVVDELVLTILSQNTNDTNRDRAWARLRERFPDWEDVVSAPVEEIADAIQPGGLHRIKARRIQQVLRQIAEEHGDLDLEHLRDSNLDEARTALSRYKGLGSKSVNCILLFSMDKPAFPADTHVHRILRRVGVLDTKSLGRANDELQDLVPDRITYSLHVNLIRHGRRVCLARGPRCWTCAIEDLCGYEDKNLEG